MAFDPADRRAPYRSPDVVLAEARRMADEIHRRAQRDANELRRAAAEWASATRREAEAYRDRVLAELEHVRSSVEQQPDELPGASADGRGDATSGTERNGSGEVIDLRLAAEARGTPMADPGADPDADSGPGRQPELDGDAAEPARAAGGSYVVGRPPPPVETSIDTKLHDVVRHAVRRTFLGEYP